jgi:hypothetical protein
MVIEFEIYFNCHSREGGNPFTVIPVKAGIQNQFSVKKSMDPLFRGDDNLNNIQGHKNLIDSRLRGNDNNIQRRQI